MPVSLSRPLAGRLGLPIHAPVVADVSVRASRSLVLGELGREILDLLQELLSETSNVESYPIIPGEPLRTDQWGFRYGWDEVCDKCKTVETLYEILKERKSEIAAIRERASAEIKPILQLADFSRDPVSGAIIVDSSRISLIENGISGTYCIRDENGQPIFVVKPIDEEIGAINNPKGFASPFKKSLIRDGVSLYTSVFREVAAWRIAQTLGVSSIAPPTTLAILQSDQFFDLSQQVSSRETIRYTEQAGPPDFEKLCSVQQFVPESKSLFEAVQDLQSLGFSDEEIAAAIDQKDFEEANLLLWVTGEIDGHLGNFLVYQKSHDEIGNQILGIQKIDNGLAFPEVSKKVRNALSHLPNAKHPLSERMLAKIQSLNPDLIAAILQENGLEASIAPMRARVKELQVFVQLHPSASIRNINKRL